MTQFLFSKRSRAILAGGVFAAIVFALGLVPRPAGAALLQLKPNTKGCVYPALTQPFLSAGDANWYTLAPGQSVDSFNGAGWTLSGGAQVKPATLANGKTGSVLNMPSGSRAVSPAICVDKGFQTARMRVRSLSSAGVHVSATYEGISILGLRVSLPRDSGNVRSQNGAWAISSPIDVAPDDRTGWQVVRFTLVSRGTATSSQIYNFYIDPRMKG